MVIVGTVGPKNPYIGIEGYNVGYKASGKKQRDKPNLRVVSVEFVPAPDAEARLARVYELLLRKSPQQLPQEGNPENTEESK